MTNVRCLIKYSPDTIEVTAGLKDRIEIWRKATDGTGKFKALLLGSWVNQFDADDPIQIRFDDIIVFEGYIDRGLPFAEGDVYNQFYQLVGRDYGQDLMNKHVNKTGNWMYKKQYADLIIADMLTKTNSEITFTPSGDHKYGTADPIPEIIYTDEGDEFLIEAFRKIFEQIDYDFYVDENKVLHIFPIGSVDSGIYLKCVAGALDNNLLNLQKTEFDSYDIKNYVIAKVEKIDDGWTDGNAADFTHESGNIVTDDFTIVNKGMGSIKCEKGTSDNMRLSLEFPKYNYDYLPFDTVQEETVRIISRFTTTINNVELAIILQDNVGNQILYHVPALPKDFWNQITFPIGLGVHIEPYNNILNTWHGVVDNGWQYLSGYSAFNWKVVKLTFLVDKNYPGNSYATVMWLDGLSIPFPMVSYKQDEASQNLYKVRRHVINARNIRTQSELDELAQSELTKLKDPLYSLHVTALGSAGIIGGAFKWIPGYMVTVHSPADGINNQQYRISEVHCVVSEAGESGHDFIVEADLVPKELSISGRRLSGVQTPEIALLRELSDRVRYFEKMEATHYDYLPPMPADAATKIKVGDFGNLSDTAVAFTRQWEAEDVEADDAWKIVDDAMAHGGKARVASALGYMRNDEVLGATQTSSYDEIYIDEGAGAFNIYFGMRVWIVHGDNSTVEVTSGTPVAIAYGSTYGFKSGTWACPGINLVSGDKIRVIIYADRDNPPTTQVQIFESEVVGAQSLKACTWTVYYYLYHLYMEYTHYYYFRYGTSTYNSRIENLGYEASINFVDGPLGCVGEFYVLMRVKVSATDATPMIQLKVIDKDTDEVLNSIEIKGINFPSADKYHAFAMRVEIPQNKQNIKIAVMFEAENTGRTVSCDYVALLPADVPLGYADVTVADAHTIETALASSHSTVTVISDGHTTETTIASAHSTVTVIASDHSTTTVIASAHSTATVIADDHTTVTSIQTDHTNATVIASAHSTTAVISNTHSTATVVATPHNTTTTIASAHGTVTVIASAHGTSVTIQDAHGTAAEIGLTNGSVIAGPEFTSFNVTIAGLNFYDLTSFVWANDVEMLIVEPNFRVTAANFTGYIDSRLRLYDETDGLYYPSANGIEILMHSDIYNWFFHYATLFIPKNVNGHTIHLQLYQPTANNMTLYGRCNRFGHSKHTHGVSVQPAQHPVTTQPADHSVQTQPSDHSVSQQPSGHPVTTQPSGQSVTTQPSGHTVSQQPSGHPVSQQPRQHPVSTQPAGHTVSTQPSGHTVQTQPSGHTVQTQPSGHVVSTQPSGHSVTTQPSGHTVIDPAHEH